jgi:multidrug resistance efflux pump
MKQFAARATVRPVPWGLDLSIHAPWARIAKVGGAVGVLAVGAYAVLADQFAIVSDNAVISAYTISLRTPIDGVVGLQHMRIGDPVKRGALVTAVTNDLADDQHLVDLREHLARARAEFAAVSKEMEALKNMSAALQRRAEDYEAASAARLQGSVSAAQSLLIALNYRRDETKETLDRRTTLSQRGFASAADLDKAKADFGSAFSEAQAQRGRLTSLEAQLAAVKNGIVTEQGSTDVAYSQQREDEIAIRLQDLTQQRRFIASDINETGGRVESEEDHVAKMRTAVVVAPNVGMIWKVSASPGERINAGATIAQIVDCDAAFVIADVQQNRVPDIQVGSKAEFLVSGETSERYGHVVSVTSDATDGDHNLAAIPFEEKGATATVRIQIDGEKGCLVGRRARVVLPSNGPGLLARLQNHLP